MLQIREKRGVRAALPGAQRREELALLVGAGQRPARGDGRAAGREPQRPRRRLSGTGEYDTSTLLIQFTAHTTTAEYAFLLLEVGRHL